MNHAAMMLACAASLLLSNAPAAHAQTATTPGAITGKWDGTAIVHHQQVPIQLEIVRGTTGLRASLLNGPEHAPASDAEFSAGHLLVSFDDYARTIDATLTPAGKLVGTFGTKTVRYPFTLAPESVETHSQPAAAASPFDGEWEIAVTSEKGEAAWKMYVEQSAALSSTRAVIQRIDGDTGSLYGRCMASTCELSHFTPAGPALYRLTRKQSPAGQEVLLVSNLLRADQTTDRQQDLIARRPTAARAANLPPPTDPAEQTTMRDPNQKFAFSAPDLHGKLVSSTDPQFDGKVVIVTVGGSWCPNCHDEAPVLESLYTQFQSAGLEVVTLSFEEEDQQKNPTRLKAFINRYRLDYTILLAGTTDQLNEKVPQALHLNSWPTSFILGRDGKVRQIHAGFAGPANPVAHDELVRDLTALVKQLLDEPVPVQVANQGR